MVFGGESYGLGRIIKLRWRTSLVCAAAVLNMVLSASCGGCAAIELTDGLSINVRDQQMGPIAPGDYEIRVVADGVPLTLSMRVATRRSPEGYEETSVSCPPDGSAPCRTSTEVGERVLHLRDGGLSPEDMTFVAHYTEDSERAGGPKNATIQFLRAGTVLGEITVSPTYSHVDHPGAGCGFATQASVDFYVATQP